MSPAFDKSRFSRLLAQATSVAVRACAASNIPVSRGALGHIAIEGMSYDRTWFTLLSKTRPPASSHARLIVEGAETELRHIGLEMLECIVQAAPVFDHSDMNATICVYSDSEHGPRLSMSLLDLALAPPGVKFNEAEILERIDTLIDRISGIEHGTRLFRVNCASDIRAATPEDACIIYTAIARPGVADPRDPATRGPVQAVELTSLLQEPS